jgi:tetratricopeptide (TPR) repeat protein
LIKTQKWEEAMSHLDKAFKVDPLLLQPYYEGAEALLGVVDKEGKSTQNERVAHILEAMKKVFGEHSDYLYLAGRHAINSGDQKTAEKFWLQALDSSKAPYFGEHYESNLEMGKLSMRAARNIHRERKFAIADYSDLLDQFNKKIDKINKKLDDRLVKKEDNEKAKAEYKQFLRMLEDKKRIDPKIFDVKIADLREAYYEEAGGYFEQAMQMRPGAVEARLWTGMIYYENGSWTDSTGHFTISAKGYLRDHDYKNSSRAYSLLANAIANQVFEDENKQLQKTPQKRLEAADKVVAFFNREVEMALREPYIQMLANKQKTIPPETTRHLVQTVQLLAKVLEDVKDINTKDAVSKIQEEAEFLQKQGLMAWGQRMQERAKAQADAPPSKPPRKTPRRRRR